METFPPERIEPGTAAPSAPPVPAETEKLDHGLSRRGRRIWAGVLLLGLLPVAAFLALIAIQVLGSLGSGAAGGCGGG
jgi:hypothetical protein